MRESVRDEAAVGRWVIPVQRRQTLRVGEIRIDEGAVLSLDPLAHVENGLFLIALAARVEDPFPGGAGRGGACRGVPRTEARAAAWRTPLELEARPVRRVFARSARRSIRGCDRRSPRASG